MRQVDAPNHRTKAGAERRQRTRRKLVMTALRLLAEHGIDEPIIDLLIKQAGVSRGTYYNHFSSERELFISVSAELSNDIIASVDPQVLQHENPVVRVACGVTLCVKLAARYPIIAAFLVKGGAQAVFAGDNATQVIARDVLAACKAGLFSTEEALAIDLVLGPVLRTFGTLLQRQIDTRYIQVLARGILLSLGVSAADAEAIASRDFGEPSPCEGALFLGT